jgi:hypothetical protein
MESLRAWVLLLAGTAFCGAAIGVLLPEGGKRTFRALCAVVFLYVCLLPLRSLSAKETDLASLLTTGEDASSSFSKQASDAAVLAAQTLLQTKIEETLAQSGVEDCVVTVRCALYDDGIAPEQITVRGSFPRDRVQTLLLSFLTANTKLQLLTEAEDEN